MSNISEQYVVQPLPNTDGDFIVFLTDGPFKDISAKIYNLTLDDDKRFTFNMDLPANKTEFFENSEFQDTIQKCVGDIIKRSADAVVKQQEDLFYFEEQLRPKMTLLGFQLGEEEFVGQYMFKKGYALYRDGESIKGINKDGNIIDMLNDDISFLKL